MRKFNFNIFFIIFSVFLFTFLSTFNSLNAIVKHSTIEISGVFEEENSTEKENNQDETNEFFFEKCFLTMSNHIIELNYQASKLNQESEFKTFYSEIIPPPPKF
jgi:hypothetical protein